MYIIFDKVQPNGSNSKIHVVKSMSISNGLAHARVLSYATIDQYITENPMANWEDRDIPIPLTSVASPEAWLISSDGPYYKGIIQNDVVDSLEGVKDKAWSRIKQSRSLAETQLFLYDGDLFDANKEQIMGAVQLAVISQLAGQPFSINWTLYDNSVKTFNAEQMISIGVELGKMVSGVYDIARGLREHIDAATTEDELSSIIWPNDIHPVTPTKDPA